MGRVRANDAGLAAAKETTLGEIPSSGWRVLEPNSIGAFGATIATVTREPIGSNRQRNKGTISDLDSAADFDPDLTISAVRDFQEGFVFARVVNEDVTGENLKPSAVTANAYTVAVPGADATAAALRIPQNALLWGRGFAKAENNGLIVVTTAATKTAIGATSAEAESASEIDGLPTPPTLSLAGLRIASATVALTAANVKPRVATLTKTGVGDIVEGMGLQVGQIVHLGSVPNDALDRALDNPDSGGGFARVKTIGDDAITFDKLDAGVTAQTSGTIDLCFGTFARNVQTDADDYRETSYSLEQRLPGLGPTGDTDRYQYSVGNYVNSLTVNLPLTDKATMSFGFIGTDTKPVQSDRASGADAASEPDETEPFNTTADIGRLRVIEHDEDGLSTDFKSLSISIGNNVSPEKVVGRLGAAFMNAGNFDVDISAQLIFTEERVPEAIRDNQTVSMDFVLKNNDGVAAVDIPSMTIGGGDREYPTNESVLINLTGQAFRDATLGTSVGISLIPVPIP